MDSRDLQVFVAVFEEGNITGAAARLCVTQPALSAAVKRLEQHFTEPLFIRQPRGVVASDVAQRLYPRAKKLLADLAEFTQSSDPSALASLVIGVEADLSSLQVASMLGRLHRVGNIQLSTRQGCAGDVRIGCESLLCADEVFVPLYSEYYVLALPPGHPLLGRERVSTNELANQPWIFCIDHASTTKLLSLLAEHSPRMVHDAESLALVAQMVAAGLGVAWLPQSLLPSGCGYVELQAPRYVRRVGLCCPANVQQHSVVAQWLTQLSGTTESI